MLIAKYSNIDLVFPTVHLSDIHKIDDSIAFDFTVNVENKTLAVKEE
ncbi:hypothetical protein KKG31_08635 [Patescibacteria group bacterium]|nr:hypothetical protein [Patescibacteria group bacterium]MBU1759119.1 hypothetical protein [Patescibacteria group bacterium]